MLLLKVEIASRQRRKIEKWRDGVINTLEKARYIEMVELDFNSLCNYIFGLTFCPIFDQTSQCETRRSDCS